MIAEETLPDVVTILVVDDNVKTAELVGRMLAAPGREVEIALGGEAALAWFKRRGHDADLVLMDETMPDLEGHFVAERMWAIRPSLPIFLMSGLEDEAIDPLLAGRPFLGFLKKPFRSWELELRVQSILGA